LQGGSHYPNSVPAADNRRCGAGGKIIKGIQDVFPNNEVIDRTFINTWQDERVVTAVKATKRKKLVLASSWTEMCLAMPAIQAQGEGFEVYVVTDASGGVSPLP
jgi:nicotinamidase-related amidase